LFHADRSGGGNGLHRHRLGVRYRSGPRAGQVGLALLAEQRTILVVEMAKRTLQHGVNLKGYRATLVLTVVSRPAERLEPLSRPRLGLIPAGCLRRPASCRPWPAVSSWRHDRRN